jgi:hypothetical protein
VAKTRGQEVIRVEASRIVGRATDEVWAYLSDLDSMPAWDPGLVEVRWHRPLGLGATVQMRDASPLLRIIGRLIRLPTFKISELEEGRRLGLRASPDGGKSWLEAVYILEALGPRETKITRVGSINGAGPWKLLELALRRRVIRERDAEVANMKRILESA